MANGGLDHPDPLRPFPAPIYLVNSTLETYLQTDPVLGADGQPSKARRAPASCATTTPPIWPATARIQLPGFYASE